MALRPDSEPPTDPRVLYPRTDLASFRVKLPHDSLAFGTVVSAVAMFGSIKPARGVKMMATVCPRHARRRHLTVVFRLPRSGETMSSVWHQAKTFPTPSVGEVWAYRARAIDELAPVQVLKMGTKSPPRLLIRFEDPGMEGREDWVPPARLKVLWSQVDGFRAEEARWAAVAALSPYQESPEVEAAAEACELLVDEEVAGFGYKDAHLVVHDVAGLAGLAGVEEGFVTAHPAGFAVDDDGPIIVPWPVAVEIIKKVIRRNPNPVLAEVTKGEAKARYEAIHGHHFSSVGRNRHDYYTPPERCVEFDNEYYAPRRALLRQWAGDTAERWDELIELRKEIKRVGEVAEGAIAALRRQGHTRDADRLATELGMTVEMLRRDTD